MNTQAVETLRIRISCCLEERTKGCRTENRGNQPTVVTEGQSDTVTARVRTGEKQVSKEVTASFTLLNGMFKAWTRVSSERRKQ